MTRFEKFLAVVLCAVLYGGWQFAQAFDVNDPFGATTRTRIESGAEVTIARYAMEADMHDADQQTVRTSILAAVAIPLSAVLVVVVLGGITLYFAGRAYLVQVEAGAGRPARRVRVPKTVQRAAQARGAVTALIEGQWALVREGKVVAWVRARQSPKRDQYIARMFRPNGGRK